MSAQQNVKGSAPFAIFGWHRHLHLYNGREQFSFRSSTPRPSCKPLLIIAKHNFTLKLRRPPEECAASCNLAPKTWEMKVHFLSRFCRTGLQMSWLLGVSGQDGLQLKLKFPNRVRKIPPS